MQSLKSATELRKKPVYFYKEAGGAASCRAAEAVALAKGGSAPGKFEKMYPSIDETIRVEARTRVEDLLFIIV